MGTIRSSCSMGCCSSRSHNTASTGPPYCSWRELSSEPSEQAGSLRRKARSPLATDPSPSQMSASCRARRVINLLRWSLLWLDLQELRGRLAEHLAPIRIAEARRFQDMVDRLVLPRDRMVGADYELAHAHFRGQVAQRLRREDQRVVVHRSEIFGRPLLQRDSRVHVGGDAQAVVRARGVRGEVAAAVGRADLQPREAIERALEDQVRERDGRVERIADRVREPAVALEALGQVRRALRMDEDQYAELLGLGSEPVKLRVGELVAGDARAHGGAAQAELLHAFLELLHREVRELERDRGERDEALRVLRAEAGERLVLDLDHLLDDIALGPIPRRVNAERLHVDALRVHLTDAALTDFADSGSAMVVDFQPEQGVGLRNHTVRVHVDHLDASAAHLHFTAPARLSARREHVALDARRRTGAKSGLGGGEELTSGKGNHLVLLGVRVPPMIGQAQPACAGHRPLWHWLLEAASWGGVQVWQILSGGRRITWAATAACPGANVDYSLAPAGRHPKDVIPG